MRLLVISALTLNLIGLAVGSVSAQDLKKGVTDLAHVDRDYAIQGEYFGPVPLPDGASSHTGLQVVALGDGAFEALVYRGGLPGGGHDGSPRLKLKGQWADDKVVLEGDGLTAELRTGYATTVKDATGRTLGHLQPIRRVSGTMGATPPANAIVLFDGRNTDRLKGAKVTSDGLLEVGCETKDAYRNFTLHAEFRTPYMPYARGQGRSNSGFYLQKRYEVQVLDSFGLELKHDDCASLYKFRAPAQNMSFPPLRWQTYDIDFTSPKFDADGKRSAKGRITVRHNGVVVHNNLELENKTGGGSPEGPNPLPTLFQNHSNPVHFRNIWLIDRDAQPESPGVGFHPDSLVAGCLPQTACPQSEFGQQGHAASCSTGHLGCAATAAPAACGTAMSVCEPALEQCGCVQLIQPRTRVTRRLVIRHR